MSTSEKMESQGKEKILSSYVYHKGLLFSIYKEPTQRMFSIIRKLIAQFKNS